MSETTATKARPVNLTASEVRAILDGTLTELIRPVKWEPASTGLPRTHLHDFDRAWADSGFPGEDGVYRNGYLHAPYAHPDDGSAADPGDDRWCRVRCPLGLAGSLLWGREAWASANDAGACWYKAGVPVYEVGSRRKAGAWDTHDRLMGVPLPKDVRWKSPVVMPRHVSRITLRIASERAERREASGWCWVVEVERVEPAEANRS